jgi:predicted dehydrogenase
MDFPSVGHGQNDLFVFQARAFLDQIAGRNGLTPCPALADGLHNMRVLEAIVAAANNDGKAVEVQ